MYEVIDGDRKIYFSIRADADNYKDYLSNGLKVVRQKGRTFFFNNGDRIIDVASAAETEKRYVLKTRNGKTISSVKLQKKHIAAINKYSK